MPVFGVDGALGKEIGLIENIFEAEMNCHRRVPYLLPVVIVSPGWRDTLKITS